MSGSSGGHPISQGRPWSQGRGDAVGTPMSLRGSDGIRTIDNTPPPFDPNAVAEEVAEDMASAMFYRVLNAPLVQIPDCDRALAEEAAALHADKQRLLSELAKSRSDLAAAGEREVEMRAKHTQAIQDLAERVEGLTSDLEQAEQGRQGALNAKIEIEEALNRCHAELNSAYDDVAAAREAPPPAHDSALENECAILRDRISDLKSELSHMQRVNATTELPFDGSDETPLLTAAYQQISVLNTQLAHLYTELTMARTEAQHLRTQQQHFEPLGQQDSALGAGGAVSTADAQKQRQQIADLVSDIRHLQLDLEYHQQKLDQMIDEKHQMVKDLKSCHGELAEARQQVEDRDQMIKHRDVDIAHLKQLSTSGDASEPSGARGGGALGAEALSALRAEATAKDSALIVSHYELHKEKLLRDRLEQKNLKLMERMQKLMMVVETMRKDNVDLERSLASRERSCEEKDLRLRQVSAKAKAKQLQRASKQPRPQASGQKDRLLDLEAHSQQGGLPPLDRSLRSDVSLGGRQSGMSTPRTPRQAPASPYTGMKM